MQLKKRGKGRVWRSLGLVTANLFVATHGLAQSVTLPSDQPDSGGNFMNDTASSLGDVTTDAGVLFYHEMNGRVKAIEPVVGLRVNRENGDSFTAHFKYDSLTGATPNGATPWSGSQVFTTPAVPAGHDVTVTSASGNQTIVTIPGTGTQVAQYTIAPHTLPVDKGFRDTRYAFDFGYSKLWHTNTTGSLGFSYSDEKDFTSYSVNSTLSQALNNQNTTLSLGINFEYDKSNPLFGTPTPLTEMNGLPKGPSDSKTVTSLKAGLTQIMNRRWLLQLNYNIGWNNGYQNDPYKIVSVVDPVTGAPLRYLYENRPGSRTRQSIYVGNKIAIGRTAADISFRYYHDSWGVHSITGEVTEMIPVSSRFYIEPEFRYYHQSAANFFHYYLPDGSLPAYASADSRLGRFSARTYGVRIGYQLSRHSNVYLMGEYYQQIGDSHVPGAPGDLAGEKLFSGVDSTSIMLGFSYSFNLSDY